jgi:hypothetical protein
MSPYLPQFLKAVRLYESPLTNWIHEVDFEGRLTHRIPLYENACAILILFMHKEGDLVREATTRLHRLLAFQTSSYLFPKYLHQYPDPSHPVDTLKQLSALQMIVHRASYLNSPISQALQEVITKGLLAIESFDFPPLWKRRYLALCSIRETGVAFSCKGADTWFEELLTEELIHISPTHERKAEACSPSCFKGGYSDRLSLLLEGPFWQEGVFVSCHPLEWSLFYTPTRSRLLRPHFCMLQAALVSPLQIDSLHPQDELLNGAVVGVGQEGCHLFWEGSLGHIHSLYFEQARPTSEPGVFLLDLHTPFSPLKKDLFEVLIYLNRHPDHQWFVQGKRATLFRMKDSLELTTQLRGQLMKWQVSFDTLEGEIAWVGQVAQGTRPLQLDSRKFQEEAILPAYDWKVGLRILRRSDFVTIRISCYQK